MAVISTTTHRSGSVSWARTLIAYLGYLGTGMFLGLVFIKSEAASWYRIQEMFRFQSFHMYGMIGSAVLVAMASIWLLRRLRPRSFEGEAVGFTPKAPTYRRYIIGGLLFGLGWAMTGACPGPIMALIGGGVEVFLVVFASALLGTYVYGAVRDRLPH